jgi:hypothetical protein
VVELNIAVLAVCGALGLLIGEIADVWYDMTHAELDPATGSESVDHAPKRPLAFGYCKTYFSDVLLGPEAFEHYHWSLWLGANAVTVAAFGPTIAAMMIGTAASLALDENRRGLADKPFGVGKPSFPVSAAIATSLFAALALRLLSVSTAYEQTTSILALVLPFAVLGVLWILQNRPEA